MTGLEPKSDEVVRDAVDAFIDGRRVGDFSGEITFETKNSRYHMVDGTLLSAPDPSLAGAEFVGWLVTSPDGCSVGASWKPRARAVLVDRKRGRHIIVTSATRSTSTALNAASAVVLPAALPVPAAPIAVVPAPPPPIALIAAPRRPLAVPGLPLGAARAPVVTLAPRPLPFPSAPPRRDASQAPTQPRAALPEPTALPAPQFDFDDAEPTEPRQTAFLLARRIPAPAPSEPFTLAREISPPSAEPFPLARPVRSEPPAPPLAEDAAVHGAVGPHRD